MTLRRFATMLIAIVVIGLSAAAAQAQLSAGVKAPDFTLPDLNEKNFTLSTCFVKPGKVVVLDLWATWCPPCRQEIPFLIDLNKKYKSKGAVFIGVALDQKKSTVSDFVKKQGITYKILHDPQAQKLADPYKIRSIPATYMIDKKGVIRYVHVGFSGKAEATKIENEIKKLLAEK